MKNLLNILLASALLVALPAAAGEAEDMAEMQRQLNAEVMAKPFETPDPARVDAWIKDAMKKDLKPEKHPPRYWKSGYTCNDILRHSYTDYRNCVYHHRYYGRYW